MPTKNRAQYIEHAIRSYQSQTYPHKELIIVDNGGDHTPDLIPNDPTIHYRRVSGPLTTGEMRNLANTVSNGQIICHFDSDDWSAPERLTQQVAEIDQKLNILTGYCSMFFYDERTQKSYKWTPAQLPFALGTSLCYLKSWWQQNPFRPVKVGEDSLFFNATVKKHKIHLSCPDVEQMMVALVHTHNTSRKSLENPRYQQVPREDLPRAFFECQRFYQPVYS